MHNTMFQNKTAINKLCLQRVAERIHWIYNTFLKSIKARQVGHLKYRRRVPEKPQENGPCGPCSQPEALG